MTEAETRLTLYLAHRRELVNYAAALTGDRSHGEDVVQEAYPGFRSDATGRPLDEPLAYLRRIIRNLAYDWHRRRQSETRHIDPAADATEMAVPQPLAEDALAVRDELRLVMTAIAELPERTRRALEMHRFEGRKLRQIAAELQVSTTTAHSLLYQGLAYCRHRLDGGLPLEIDASAVKPAPESVNLRAGNKSRGQ